MSERSVVSAAVHEVVTKVLPNIPIKGRDKFGSRKTCRGEDFG